MRMGESARRLAARLVSIYLGVYVALMVASMVPGLGGATARLVLVIARAMFGPDVPDGSMSSGSGDRAVHWASFVLTLLVAGLVTSLWSLRPPRRVVEDKAHAVLHGAVRFYLFWMMLGYGTAKVIKGQFPTPNAVWLDEALGDMSPMRLLWAFMGHSTAYTVFTGATELLAGVLILFRRTRLIGALLVAAIMSNVLMLNLSYDVPVKLGSSHFLLMAFFVAWPDRARLAALLVPHAEAPWPAGRARTVLLAAGGIAALLAAAFVGYGAWGNYHTWGDGRPKAPHEGRYVVSRFVVDGVEVPSGGAPDRWQRVAITDRYVLIRSADDELHAHPVALAQERITLAPRIVEGKPEEGAGPIELRVTAGEGGALELVGERDGARLSVSLTPKASRLNDRGFHWVTEFPYNR